MDGYRYQFTVGVRFADLDALGHVNHAKFFTYMETARMGYLREVLGWSGEMNKLTLILAKAEAEYKLPLVLGDDPTVHTAITRLGNSSFDMEYALTRQGDGELAATGKTVLVVFDYNTGKPRAIPEGWRETIAKYEPALGGR